MSYNCIVSSVGLSTNAANLQWLLVIRSAGKETAFISLPVYDLETNVRSGAF